MEEALREALLAAAEQLGKYVKAGLMAHGLPDTIDIRIEDRRISVVSRSPAVLQAELGAADVPPMAPMEEACRQAGHEVLAVLHGRLREALI